jgi:hypothetical protein
MVEVRASIRLFFFQSLVLVLLVSHLALAFCRLG